MKYYHLNVKFLIIDAKIALKLFKIEKSKGFEEWIKAENWRSVKYFHL